MGSLCCASCPIDSGSKSILIQVQGKEFVSHTVDLTQRRKQGYGQASLAKETRENEMIITIFFKKSYLIRFIAM